MAIWLTSPSVGLPLGHGRVHALGGPGGVWAAALHLELPGTCWAHAEGLISRRSASLFRARTVVATPARRPARAGSILHQSGRAYQWGAAGKGFAQVCRARLLRSFEADCAPFVVQVLQNRVSTRGRRGRCATDPKAERVDPPRLSHCATDPHDVCLNPPRLSHCATDHMMYV